MPTGISSGGGGASSVAAADITDATATGRSLLVASSAASAMSALRADFVASYNFSSSTGITLTNGSAGGTAAIAGGVLALTCPATPEARYYGGYREAPRASVALPTVDGRPPLRWRATIRLKSCAANAVPRFLAKNVLASTMFMGFYLASDGTIGAENNSTPSAYGSSGGGTFALDGTGWLEMEVFGDFVVFKYGVGTTTNQPSTWTVLVAIQVPGQVFGTLEIVGSTNGAPGSTKLVEWDDLSIAVW